MKRGTGKGKEKEKILDFWVLAYYTKSGRNPYREVIRRMETDFPGVKVSIRVLSWANAIEEIVAALRKRSGPDLLQIGSTWTGFLKQIGAVSSLPVAPGELTAKLDLTPAARNRLYRDREGRVYSVPWTGDTRAVFFRKDILSRCGLAPGDLDDWDGFREACRRVRARFPELSPLGMSGLRDPTLLHYLAPWIWAAGGGFISPDGDRTIFADPAAWRGVDFILDLIRDELIPPGHLELSIGQIADNFFRRGKYAFSFDSVYSIDQLDDQRFGAALYPEGPRGRYVYSGGCDLAVFRHSENPELAWRLAEMLLRPENQIRISRHLGGLPVIRESLNDPVFRRDPRYRVFIAGLKEYGKTFPAEPYWLAVENIMIETWAEILAAFTAGRSRPEAAREAWREAARESDEFIRNFQPAGPGTPPISPPPEPALQSIPGILRKDDSGENSPDRQLRETVDRTGRRDNLPPGAQVPDLIRNVVRIRTSDSQLEAARAFLRAIIELGSGEFASYFDHDRKADTLRGKLRVSRAGWEEDISMVLIRPDSTPDDILFRALHSKEKILLFDPPDRKLKLYRQQLENSTAVIRVETGRERAGLAVVRKKNDRPRFPDSELSIYRYLTGQLEIALAKIRRLEKDRSRLNELDILQRISWSLFGSATLEKTVQETISVISRMMGYDRISLYLMGDNRSFSRGCFHADMGGNVISTRNGDAVPPPDDTVMETVKSQEDAFRDRGRESPDRVRVIRRKKSVYIPIVARRKVLGVLQVSNPISRRKIADPELRTLIVISNRIGLIVENTFLWEEIRTSEEKYRTLVDNMFDIHYLRETDGRFIYVSPSIEQVLGYDPEEWIGSLPPAVEGTPWDRSAPPDRESTQSRSFTFRLNGRDGAEITMEAREIFLRDNNLIQGIARDITERERLQKALIEQEKQKSLLDLLRGLADTLNNRLAAALGYFELITGAAESKNNETMIRLLPRLSREMNRMKEIMKELTESGYIKEINRLAAVDLKSAIELTLLNFPSESIVNNVEDDLPPIKGLPQLPDILAKPIRNALEAIGDGGRVELTARPMTDRGMVELTIEDDGCGIPQDRMEKIFTPFYTSKGTISPGLGLWRVSQAMDRMGGEVKIESREGEGTRCILRFPVYDTPG